MPSSQEERRSQQDNVRHKPTNLTVPVPTWQASRPKSSPTSSSAQNLPPTHTHTHKHTRTHTHSRSDSKIPQTHSRPGSATEPSWQPEPPRSLWERPRFLAEDGGDRGVRFQDGEGGQRGSKEEIEREREVRRRSIRVDSYDDRPKREEGCCGCVVM